MKSMPLTMRGPVDDENFSWVRSNPLPFESKGEIGLRTLRRSSPASFTHRRHRTTGSAQVATMTSDGRAYGVSLPKIATGRSAHSAKKMWNDHETVKIRTVIQRGLENPRIPPLYVPKYPKPLYKRPVDETKRLDTLHLREFVEKGEVDPHDLTDSSQFYAQITFLRNAVRNTDGTTSYQNLTKKPRSWSEPTAVDDLPGLIKGNRLHWESASTTMKHPRMLLPLEPGPSTNWYAWKPADQPARKTKKNAKTKSKTQESPRGVFLETFTPQLVPHPTPSFIKGRSSKPSFPDTVPEGESRPIDPQGVTFMTNGHGAGRDDEETTIGDDDHPQELPDQGAVAEEPVKEGQENGAEGKSQEQGEVKGEAGEGAHPVQGEDGRGGDSESKQQEQERGESGAKASDKDNPNETSSVGDEATTDQNQTGDTAGDESSGANNDEGGSKDTGSAKEGEDIAGGEGGLTEQEEQQAPDAADVPTTDEVTANEGEKAAEDADSASEEQADIGQTDVEDVENEKQGTAGNEESSDAQHENVEETQKATDSGKENGEDGDGSEQADSGNNAESNDNNNDQVESDNIESNADGGMNGDAAPEEESANVDGGDDDAPNDGDLSSNDNSDPKPEEGETLS